MNWVVCVKSNIQSTDPMIIIIQSIMLWFYNIVDKDIADIIVML